MNISFESQTAIVTGATRGIGFEIAIQLAQAGCKVIGIGASSESASAMNEKWKDDDLDLEFVPVDLGDKGKIEEFLSELESTRIDILVNNAGINKVDAIEKLDIDDWDRVQAINVRAPMILCKVLVPKMMNQNYGKILNIASIFAHLSKSGRVSYSTSKSALLGMTRALALDSAKKNVLVNSLSPGFIDTELTRRVLSPPEIEKMVNMVPMGRLGAVEEIAQAACFLVSKNNSFITGQAIIADGGFSIA